MKLWKSRKGASCGTSGSEATSEATTTATTTTTTGCVSGAGSSNSSSNSKGGILSKSCKFGGASSRQGNGTGGNTGSFDEGSSTETSFTTSHHQSAGLGQGQGGEPANGTVVVPAMVQHPAASMFSDRAMSPAQSEDSGLAADRGTAYATIAIPRCFDGGQPGIVLADRLDLSFPPVVESISGPVADLLAPGDRIHQVDGISTVGLGNEQILGLLCHSGAADGPVMIEIEYSFPEYISQNSLCVTTKIAQITVEREHGCLGLTLRGGGEYPLVVTNVRPNGPVFRTGQIKPGDRVLRVDNVSLLNKSLPEAQRILKEEAHASGYTSLTIEYDVSVMQTVELSMGPLLLEIERPLNERLGLILSHYAGAINLNHDLNYHHQHYPYAGAPGYHNKLNHDLQPDGIFIASILPASIADRCGALSVGDQILAIDEAIVDNGACTLEEATALLDANCAKGYTQLHMLPAHTFVRRRGVSCSSPRYGFNTVDSRKNLIGVGVGSAATVAGAGKNRRLLQRKSSLPQSMEPQLQAGVGAGAAPPPPAQPLVGLCKTEQIHIILDCSQGSGICLGPKTACGRGYVIAQVLPDSVAERSGCLQQGDRITAINKLCNLDAATVRQILGDYGPPAASVAGNHHHHHLHHHHYHNQPPTAHWVELEIEFDMADTVVPASGVFNIKLVKHGRYGLGITVNATSHGTFMVAEVKPGSAAHRTGSLRAGDQLLAVDNRPLQHYNLDLLLKESQHELITLTVKRCSLPEFIFPDQQQQQQQQQRTAGAGLYGSVDAEDIDYGYSPRYEGKALPPPLPPTGINGEQQEVEVLRRQQQGQDGRPGEEDEEEQEEEEEVEVQLRRPVWSATSSYDAGHLPLPPPHLLLVASEGGGGGEGRPTTNDDDRYDDILHYKMASMNISNSNYVGYGQQQQQQHQRINNQTDSLDPHPHQPSDGPLYLAHPDLVPPVPPGHRVFSVRLEPHGGPLGITLAASDDLQKPIRISALTEGGIAYNTGQLQVGDWLLAINGESIVGVPLTTATKLLHRYDHAVELQMARPPPTLPTATTAATATGTATATTTVTPPPPPEQQLGGTAAAVYAKVQRRPRSPGSQLEATSNNGSGSGASTAGSGSASGPGAGHHRTMQVTLFKDRVYDDYGFSVSDGLYERGVYINRIRSGGPADLGSLLRPFDRIVQVNGTKTQDFDCCLTVPLIAAAGDKIELVIQRTLPE